MRKQPGSHTQAPTNSPENDAPKPLPESVRELLRHPGAETRDSRNPNDDFDRRQLDEHALDEAREHLDTAAWSLFGIWHDADMSICDPSGTTDGLIESENVEYGYDPDLVRARFNVARQILNHTRNLVAAKRLVDRVQLRAMDRARDYERATADLQALGINTKGGAK